MIGWLMNLIGFPITMLEIAHLHWVARDIPKTTSRQKLLNMFERLEYMYGRNKGILPVERPNELASYHGAYR